MKNAGMFRCSAPILIHFGADLSRRVESPLVYMQIVCHHTPSKSGPSLHATSPAHPGHPSLAPWPHAAHGRRACRPWRRGRRGSSAGSRRKGSQWRAGAQSTWIEREGETILPEKSHMLRMFRGSTRSKNQSPEAKLISNLNWSR